MAVHDTLQNSLPSREGLREIITARNVLFLVCGWIVYKLLRAAWNISPYHPLSHFPGPKLAAATYLPEFWYDVVKFGRYTHEIKKMHEIYGPMVRINPDEIHCNDVSFVDTIYAASGRRRDKSQHQFTGSPWAYSGFATIDHDVHRMRRAPLNKFFSRTQLSRFEPQIQNMAGQLCDKFLVRVGDSTPTNTQSAYSCFTSDVIADYCFGGGFGFLQQEAWEPSFKGAVYSLLRTVFACRFFPFLKHTAMASSWFSRYLPESMAMFVRTLNTTVPNLIKKTKSEMAMGVERGYPTVFGELLKSDLPAREKTASRLVGESAALIGGGTETTSWALSVLTFHLLSQPQQLSRLTGELRAAVEGDPLRTPPWFALEKLPYLSAVIQEGLRLSYGTTGRLARVAPDEDLVYRGAWTPRGGRQMQKLEYVLPRGYAVGMSNPLVHHDESLFPDSHSFIPERWLDGNMQRNLEPDRYLLSFSKGSRMCLAKNLALCELHIALASLVLRVFPHMRLFETTEEDVKYDHDIIVTGTRSDSKGVRVLLV